jgi:hypothetical protein
LRNVVEELVLDLDVVGLGRISPEHH